jgi:hypothetical protein
MKKKLLLFILFIAALQLNNISAQDITADKPAGETQNFALGADFVNQYIWRGLPFSTSPNIQPYLSYTNDKGNFTVGSWASYSLADYYAEVDWFANYSIGAFTISLWDYFNMSQQQNNNYFDYLANSTSHAFEGTVAYGGPESFPIQLSWATFFYGNDVDLNGDNYYSSYFEVSYPFKWKKNEIKVFAGITPWEGLYADKFAMNNLGVTNSRTIKINENFSLPISGSIIFNPNQENIFFVLAIGLSAND